MSYHFRTGFRRSALVVALALLVAPGTSAAELRLTWVADERVVHETIVDLPQLDELPQTTLVTKTPWTSGVTTFVGPELRTLAKLGPGNAVSAEFHALNDYSASVPAKDWTDYNVILATRIDGAVPRVYEKGPYWLMYPLDQMAQPTPQIYITRMIWQVDSIRFYVE